MWAPPRGPYEPGSASRRLTSFPRHRQHRSTRQCTALVLLERLNTLMHPSRTVQERRRLVLVAVVHGCDLRSHLATRKEAVRMDGNHRSVSHAIHTRMGFRGRRTSAKAFFISSGERLDPTLTPFLTASRASILSVHFFTAGNSLRSISIIHPALF